MSLIHYLLEANLYLAAFYLLYVLLLRSETLYQLNRAYLLGTSLLAFIIPVLQLGILKPEIKHLENTGSISIDMEPVSVSVIPASVVAPKWGMIDYALALYGIVTLVMFVLLVYKIVKLVSLSKKGDSKRQNGFTVIEIPGENVAFSFFGYLFVNRELSTSETIIHHEQVHIRQKHSWDVIYLELLKIFNWFNPAIYLLQKSLKEVHEFIADEQVAEVENGAADYADFLISNAYGLTQNQLTNSFFNKNLLKRRIIMLYQKKSGRAARLKYLLTLPLMGGLLCLSTLAFTTKNYGLVDLAPKHIAPAYSSAGSELTDTNGQSAKYKKLSNTKHNVDYPKESISAKAFADSIFNTVEVAPIFPGREVGLSAFLRNNIKYPAAAKANNVSGKVFVEFVVEKDGSLSNAKVLRNPGSGLGEEALRVINLSPKWTPGTIQNKTVRVRYVVPISFSMIKADKETATTPSNPDSVYRVGIEVNPSFPGGEVAFSQFLRDNIRYPKEAKENNVQGRTFTQFIVEKDGSLSNLKAVRDPGTGLGAEALRVLTLSPKWLPGRNNGEYVRVQYVVPINFSLADDRAGSVNDLTKYIRDHVRYPRVAKEANIQGQSFVSFSVNDQKQIQDLKMLKSPDQSISDEILRVLRNFKTIIDAKPGFNYILPVSMAIDHGDGANKSAEKTPTEIAKLYDKSNTIILSEISVIGYGTIR
jgi:TonB family protein